MAELAFVVGFGLSAKAARDVGKAQNANAVAQALQLEQRARVTRGASQRAAIRELDVAENIQSRALALAAASGAGVTNPTVLNILADIEAEGEYRSLTQLYTGEDEARGMEAQAKSLRRTGSALARAGKIKAIATILSGVSEWQSRYGGAPAAIADEGDPTAITSSFGRF